MSRDIRHDPCPALGGSHCTHWDCGMEVCCGCDMVCWVEPELLDRLLAYLDRTA